MLQYLINTSIIWLACLLLYELLLRNESFHQFNRIYLMACIVAGLLLPSANLNRLMPIQNNILLQPTGQVYVIKKAIQVNEISVPIASVDHTIEHILWIIYLTGMLIGMLLLVWEILTLFRLYINGRKSSETGYTIVETGKDSGPFSIFNIIFIRNRQDYNQAQWSLLMAHEKEHNRQLHLLDNLFLIILRIVCWFNPLPHIYYKRLRMVHEFQADNAAAINTTDYGTFLLEQNLLQGAPILTHSFNYSPIKTRITMLTKTRSTRTKLLKCLTVVPLFGLLIIFCTQTSFTGQINKKGTKVYFKGNEIEFGELKVVPYEYREIMQQQKKIFLRTAIPDSVPIKNYVTGEITRMDPVLSDIIPIAINGKHIFGHEPQYMLSEAEAKYFPPVFYDAEKDFEKFLFSKTVNELNTLEDGSYIFHLKGLVINDKGNVAYYEKPSIQLFIISDEKNPIIADAVKQKIEQQFIEVLEGSLKFKPALKNGKPVNARLSLEKYIIDVKSHKAQLVERGGC